MMNGVKLATPLLPKEKRMAAADSCAVDFSRRWAQSWIELFRQDAGEEKRQNERSYLACRHIAQAEN